MDAFHGDHSHLAAAEAIRNAGELLTVSEVNAANRFWHVWESPTHNNTYPKEYKQPVVGMLYQTMASFQTWFGPEPFYSYGIQLLPLTSVGERRDDPTWATELYPMYDKACLAELELCADNGWTIIQYGLLATTGHREDALEEALLIPSDVFASEGGVGNSMSNTIWYISTRKPIEATSNF
jgi:endoglucanase Acf2